MRNGDRAISVDIGSTHTKGALIELDGQQSRIIARASHPTTQHNLSDGFDAVLASLSAAMPEGSAAPPSAECPVHWSSSAKGGLAIVAIGLVPDLTLNLARRAAMSAGGKVIGSYAFALTREDIRAIERQAPDIVLLAGGTDGGHREHVLHNAEALARSTLSVPILYAGNRSLADTVADRLHHKALTVTENIMPAMQTVNVEPARAAIQSIFLERLVAGKGLAELMDRLGTSPRPTPLGVFQLVEAIPRACPAWSNIGLIDLGGATTDVYTNGQPVASDDSVVVKGVLDPAVKRTVEGDLGLRVSAPMVLESMGSLVQHRLAEYDLDESVLNHYMHTLALNPAHIARSEPDMTLDRLLAEACVRQALSRHAGRFREAFTPHGKVQIQTGKDIRHLQVLIGSGGFLSSLSDLNWLAQACRAAGGMDDDGTLRLTPQDPAIFTDAPYLMPLLGNIAEAHPIEAAALAISGLKRHHDSSLNQQDPSL